MPIEDTLFEELDLNALKKGEIVKNTDITKIEDTALPIKIGGMRILLSEINKVYKSGKGLSKNKLRSLFEGNQEKMCLYANNAVDCLEKSEEVFKVSKRKIDKKGNITLKLQKIDTRKRADLIKEVAKKLADKLNKEQLAILLEEGLKKNSDTDAIFEAKKQLEKEKPKIKEHRGCFIITVNDKEVMVVG